MSAGAQHAVPPVERTLDIVVLGLSITSSWGNGHATTYRALIRALHERGHRVLFLERDVPWYAAHRDLPDPPFGRTRLYADLSELRHRFGDAVRNADLVMVGSYVPDGVAVGEWVVRSARGVSAFYDIDTPITIARLERGETDYISRDLIPRFDLYLSFTGGPLLDHIAHRHGAHSPRPLHCSVDPELYFAEPGASRWDLGYMGTYSEDRQPVLESLLLEPARAWPSGQFIIAGPQYPERLEWPANVERVTHLPPASHRRFYNAQRFTLNITRRDMVAAGYSPSVRLFEAAACATPIISDVWPGLDTFFRTGVEVLVATSPAEVLAHLQDLSDTERRRLGEAARRRVLSEHTATHRAAELERYTSEAMVATSVAARAAADGS